MIKPQKDYIFVGIQLLLFVLYLYNPEVLNFSLNNVVKTIGLVIAFAGVLVVVLAFISLNRNLSPFPTPKVNSKLVQNGIYQLVRHPIYTGIILTTFGWAIYSQSSTRLVTFVLIYILFHFKSNYEEKQLAKKFELYNTYKKNTGKFFPNFNQNNE